MVVRGGNVGSQAGERPGEVGRAARHREPPRALAASGVRALRVAVGRCGGRALLQRVGVEERMPVQCRRGGDHAEEDPLDRVGVAGLPGRQQQPPAEHDRGDPGAGLRVGAVGWQLEIVPERLAGVTGAHPAGEVGPRRHGVAPLLGHGLQQATVAGLDRHVHGTAGQVQGAHRMAAQHPGLTHRQVVLVVGGAEPTGGLASAHSRRASWPFVLSPLQHPTPDAGSTAPCHRMRSLTGIR